MNTIINVKKLGLAFGLTSALLYLGCVVVMGTVGRANTVNFLIACCMVLMFLLSYVQMCRFGKQVLA